MTDPDPHPDIDFRGLVPCVRWRPDVAGAPAGHEVQYCAVAVKR